MVIVLCISDTAGYWQFPLKLLLVFHLQFIFWQLFSRAHHPVLSNGVCCYLLSCILDLKSISAIYSIFESSWAWQLMPLSAYVILLKITSLTLLIWNPDIWEVHSIKKYFCCKIGFKIFLKVPLLYLYFVLFNPLTLLVIFADIHIKERNHF